MLNADALRRFSDEELALLLTVRPELMDPPPNTFLDLALRSNAPFSIQACINQLDQYSRQVLEAVAYLESSATVADVCGLPSRAADPADVYPVLDYLRTIGMLQAQLVTAEGPLRWSVPVEVRRSLPNPFSLRPSLAKLLERFSVMDLRVICSNLRMPEKVAAKVGLIADIVEHLTSPGAILRLLEEAPADAVYALRRIHENGGIATLDSRPYSRSELPAGVVWLLSTGLAVAASWENVVIPREVSLVLRGGAPIAAFASEPPTVAVRTRSAPMASTTPMTEFSPTGLLEMVTQIGATFERTNPVPLKSSGVAVKDIRALSKYLGVDERSTCRLIELAGLAGLISSDGTDERITVTALFDEWLREEPYPRWKTLADAWVNAGSSLSRVVPSASKERGEAPLSINWYLDFDEVWRRSRVMSAFSMAPGNGPVDLVSIYERAVWFGPGRWKEVDDPVEATTFIVEEAALLGIARSEGLTPLGRALLFGTGKELQGAAGEVFPEAVSTFTVQADLTALAPGELAPVVSGELALVADAESRGAATLYRFTEASLRRAFDHGRTAESIIEFLGEHARPTVPQPLRYLVEDVGRRYGMMRVGSAISYVCVEDPVLLTSLMHNKKTAKLGLRQVAPTVAVSSLPIPKVLTGLRAAGFLPAPVDDSGAAIAAGSSTRRPTVPARARSERSRAHAIWDHVRGGSDSSVSTTHDSLIKKLRAK